jgi:hypothetical protein
MLAFRRHHDSRVVDQDVDRLCLAQHRVGERGHRFQGRQVDQAQGEPRIRILGGERGNCRVTPALIPHGQCDVCSRLREPASELETETTVGAGNDRPRAGQVVDIQKVLSSGHEFILCWISYSAVFHTLLSFILRWVSFYAVFHSLLCSVRACVSFRSGTSPSGSSHQEPARRRRSAE